MKALIVLFCILGFSLRSFAGEAQAKALFFTECTKVAARIALRTGNARSTESANAWAADECGGEWMLADYHDEIKKWTSPKFEGCLAGVRVNFIPSDSPDFRKKALADNCLEVK